MRIAITVWKGRIAPLFDVSKQILIVVTEGYGKLMECFGTEDFIGEGAQERANYLQSLGIDGVICGAISTDFEEKVIAKGIELDAFVAGDVQEIVEAWRMGTLRHIHYAMPGCRSFRHRRRRMRGCHGQWCHDLIDSHEQYDRH